MNKYAILALLWFAISIYSLIFRESTGESLPIPHFDKIGHLGIFFVQFWLMARAFIQSNKAVPYLGLMISALFYAFGTELGQATFTETRQGSWLDGLADLCGAGIALLIVKYLYKR
ncbi:VanZ family protein [Mannheimia bovis]|uniref:VanZ family protein n=1 Tax=Mannheimia bovis TaxID=2770636 RepID=A0A7H1C179_9PAST|nr:VanZ family protein [Mannheimia bovis]QNS14734.1 VanZ family protein [Mannheimia bovis]